MDTPDFRTQKGCLFHAGFEAGRQYNAEGSNNV
jgi:hypothetical protein